MELVRDCACDVTSKTGDDEFSYCVTRVSRVGSVSIVKAYGMDGGVQFRTVARKDEVKIQNKGSVV
jgi:hypothetical protein